LLDLLYGAAVGVRRRWYERHPEARRRLRQPVISIGNLSVGGTGKTPLVSLVAEHLLAHGEHPAVLSRGYGRRVTDVGAIVVSDGTRVLTDLDHAGDEPLMLARALPGLIVVVAEDRHLAGVLAEARLGATVHLLDDGFQHVQLARNLDLLVTSVGEITGGRVLPFGRLREAPSAAARAHVVVIVGADEAAARSEAWTLGVSEWVAATRTLAAPYWTGQPIGPVLAVAGIGNPQQFFDGLTATGWNVLRSLRFPDHHRYTVTDVAAIGDAARSAGADVVVTTSKDYLRFEPLGPLPFVLLDVDLTLTLDPARVLFDAVDAALARAREVA
jgi:tetraacyldisaccharide 4'-kinase